ncbi:hypothetical protein [Natrononativus amylolyticus]|uniref:hypothetical protein n=1 Tax=Natrononativus amylolyticus TaxID=2963434 RepID=UPI0020CE093A|nr:hypothetical protein [Natrononativus amylolyticus]
MTADSPDDPLEAQVRALHDHLEATASLPIDHRTNRWLGEAEAVVRDAAENDLDDATVRKRVGQARHLLEEAGETGDERADEHLGAAHELCAEILAGRDETGR